MSMNHDELEDWALRALQMLQNFCDEAQEAAGNLDGEDQLTDVRALMLEYERIASELPAWQARCLSVPDEDMCILTNIKVLRDE